MVNPELALQLSKLMDIVSIVTHHLENKAKANQSTARITLRGAQEIIARQSPKELFYESILRLRKQIDHRIRTSINDAGSKKKNYLVTD